MVGPEDFIALADPGIVAGPFPRGVTEGTAFSGVENNVVGVTLRWEGGGGGVAAAAVATVDA